MAKKAYYGVGDSKTVTGKGGVQKANVTAEQLKASGYGSLREYMNAWNRDKTRPTAGSGSSRPKSTTTADSTKSKPTTTTKSRTRSGRNKTTAMPKPASKTNARGRNKGPSTMKKTASASKTRSGRNKTTSPVTRKKPATKKRGRNRTRRK